MNNKTTLPVTRIIVFLLLLLGSSCSKFLDQQPEDGIISKDFWKTKEQVYAAVIGCYSSLLGPPAGVSDRSLPEYLFLWGELRADFLTPGAGITTDEQEIVNVNILPTNSIAKWSAVYRTINNCNTVIDNAAAVRERDNTFTQAQLNGYVAEALALRSLMYFYLIRTFGDVPLVLKSTATDEDINPIAKSTQKIVLDQITADLVKAERDATISYGSKLFNTGRITKNTVQTILADVYLWQEKYTEAIAECDKVIASGNYGLVERSSGWFSTVYANGNSSEGIFEIQYSAEKLNTFFPLFATSRKRYVASNYVLEDIYTLDYNDDANLDIRGVNAAVKVSDNSVFKYIGFNSITSRTAADSYAHWFFYRYSDILLMKAEACAQVNRGAEALDLVKVIRNRANALSSTEQNLSADDVEGISDYILEERAREFSFEGKRWFDLLRNAKRNNYKRLDIITAMVARTVPAARQQSALNKYRDLNSHYLPIYFSELSTNNLLIQNPFYR
jgi:hypothetical protein